MRIAWLLLSLSFLCHSVCSDNTTDVTEPKATTVSSSSEPTKVVTTEKATDAKPADPVTNNSPSPTISISTVPPAVTSVAGPATTSSTKVIIPTAAPTTPTIPTLPATATAGTKPAIATTATTATTPATPATTATATTALIATTATKPAAATTATAAAAPTVTTTTTTADVGGSAVVSPSPTAVQTSEASVSSKTTGTDTSGSVSLVETSNITKVSTDASARQQSSTHTTITQMSEGDKAAGAVPRNWQTTSRAPEPTVNLGANLTTTASHVAGKLPGTTSLQTTTSISTTTATTTTTTITTTESQPKVLQYSLNSRHENEKDKEMVEVCRRLMANLQDGNCSLIWRRHNGKVQFDLVEINGKVKTTLAAQYYEEISKKSDNKTLIAILASCGALLIMIVILAVCASHHRKPYSENQQLTEELHTVENGYHDNPTLEVMEVQPEMQEKKVALNGEFNDSWIVPIDNLLKDDIPDEEDTHL